MEEITENGDVVEVPEVSQETPKEEVPVEEVPTEASAPVETEVEPGA